MEGKPLSLRRLGYFVNLADELHFGRAAEQLHIAQPALSRQIRQLESELQTVLFERTTRRVSLTAAGEALLDRARRLLADAEEIEQVARELREGERGVLRIGFVDSTAYELVPRVLRRCRERRPNVDFELHTMSSDEQYEALRAGRIDLGIGRTAGGAGDLRADVLGTEPLVLAVGSEHRLIGRESVALADVHDQTFIGFDREVSPTLHSELRVMLAAAGVIYSLGIQATEYTTILGLVAAGAGVAIVPSSVQTFHPPGLQFLPIQDPSARVDLVVLSHRVGAGALVAGAIEIIAELIAESGLRTG